MFTYNIWNRFESMVCLLMETGGGKPRLILGAGRNPLFSNLT
jgi:hypothetical protein